MRRSRRAQRPVQVQTNYSAAHSRSRENGTSSPESSDRYKNGTPSVSHSAQRCFPLRPFARPISHASALTSPCPTSNEGSKDLMTCACGRSKKTHPSPAARLCGRHAPRAKMVTRSWASTASPAAGGKKAESSRLFRPAARTSAYSIAALPAPVSRPEAPQGAHPAHTGYPRREGSGLAATCRWPAAPQSR